MLWTLKAAVATVLLLIPGVLVSWCRDGAPLLELRSHHAHQNHHHHRKPSPVSTAPPPRCASSFGEYCGSVLGVPAFSNCNDDFIGTSSNFVPLQNAIPRNPQCDAISVGTCPARVYTGLQWQCVEYGRRVLLAVTGASFGSVVGAADIWHLDNVTEYQLRPTTTSATNRSFTTCSCSPTQRPFTTVPNGQSPNVWVLPGDLVIYERGAVGPYGHVCAVSRVVPVPSPANSTSPVATVYIGEENWNNQPWPVQGGPSAYARKLLLVPASASDPRLVLRDRSSDGLYPILGVKRFTPQAVWN